MKTLFISAFASALLVAGIAYADVAPTHFAPADTSIQVTKESLIKTTTKNHRLF